MNTEESLSVREHPKMPRLADYRLIAFDMDSTLINIECVDEIADAVNKKEEVAAITEAAMQGIISDYKESLRQRVALLKGVPEHTLQAIYDERLQLNPGAEALMDACKQAGLKTLLVSGGFTFFTERIRTRLGVDLRVQTSWKLKMARSPDASCPSLGAIFATELKKRVPCWKWPRSWVFPLNRSSLWAMAQMT